jgi:hypothetical protein
MLNGDLNELVAVDTASMEWTPSPSGTVWRKRVHRVGPPESGQVTSVVRYEPDSTFPAHDHPEGEEILVLDGVFSDEHGDWPTGTYLLNPEGFRHAPFSKDGCRLFVKLRQFPGRDREHVATATGDLGWQPSSETGIETKLLYRQPGYSDTMQLERWAAGVSDHVLTDPNGLELFVLDGALETTDSISGEVSPHSAEAWLRIPAGQSVSTSSAKGCICYVKRGGFPYLRSA